MQTKAWITFFSLTLKKSQPKEFKVAHWIAISSCASTSSANISDFLVAVEADIRICLIFSHNSSFCFPSNNVSATVWLFCMPSAQTSVNNFTQKIWASLRSGASHCCFWLMPSFWKMGHTGLELPAGRTNIYFSLHSSLKQQFSTSTFLLLEQGMLSSLSLSFLVRSLVHWPCRVNKQFDWLKWVKSLSY